MTEPTCERNPLMLKTLGKIAKFMVIAYLAVFMLLIGMIIMTNIMLSGLS